MRAGEPHATATPTSAASSKAWSFSASPIASRLWPESRSAESASRSPVALLTAWGRIISRVRLNASTSGSSIARTISSTTAAAAAGVSTTHSPSTTAMPRLRSASAKAGGGGECSRRLRPLAGKVTTAPFSATTASAKLRSPAARRRSASTRPVTSMIVTPAARVTPSASRTSADSTPSSAVVPS